MEGAVRHKMSSATTAGIRSRGTRPSMNIGSYYEPAGENRYKPTAHAGGAWDPAEQHFSPLGGLVVHAIDRFVAGRPGEKLVLSRISYDILGRLALDECEIRVETLRPGRTIELVEAVVLIGDRAAVRARAWLLSSGDTRAVAGGDEGGEDGGGRLTPPEELASWSLTDVWPGGYIASVDVRPVAPPRPGRTTAWIGTGLDLVAGEASSPLASFVALIDTANGIAVRQSPTEWMFPNVDLTVHLHRQPEGRWTGLDTTVSFGPTGQGVTSTVLHDVAGPVGHAEQMLTVRPL
ncbi:conserved hypothetical protein [Catenulispora acidiphila DSM 44928]|uniref:Thioesterase n=2 Tax=Catenulispora TaxID=414878 RepID=C7Q578_CATAD|nr:conserved hypothetical protein [Catenulispora acidiphila DSM 44928]